MTQAETRSAAPAADLLWLRARGEAEDAIRAEPAVAAFMEAQVLGREGLLEVVLERVAGRLAHPAVGAGLLSAAFRDALARDPSIAPAVRADLAAVLERDPACTRVVEPLLYFKGFHALQAHRFAHALWLDGRRDLALYLQSRSSEVFQTDIHPAARFGQGVFLDHATGLVVGMTASVGDGVSMLQGVTLGGTGKERGDRHPKIGRGVLVGAGAKVLGNIEVGCCARIAAGSVVLKPVPPNVTVAGVPARVIGTAGCDEPARSMNQGLEDLATFRGEGI